MMHHKLSILLLCALQLSAVFKSSFAINEETARESPCLKIQSAVDPEPTWFSSVDKWYYPLGSRLDLYRSVHDLLETDYSNIPEYSVYYDSCLEWTISSAGFTVTGFNGRTRHLRTTTVAQGVSDFNSEWPKGMTGRAYTTLTDNKTFAFTAACFADNQMSWNVFSTTKTLDEPTKKAIYDHATSLGYNPKFFTEMKYDSCSDGIHRAPTQNRFSSATAPNTVSTSLPVPVISPKPTISTNGSFLCDACKRLCQNRRTPVAYKSFDKNKQTNYV